MKRPIEVLERAVTLRPAEVELLYGISRRTVLSWCQGSELRSVKSGGLKSRRSARLIFRKDLDAFLEKNATKKPAA